MFYFVILVSKHFIMNSFQFKHSTDQEYPAIELDMTNFMEHLSDENIFGKAEVENDDVRTSPKIIHCNTEDRTNLSEISSFPEIKLEQEEKVNKFDRISCVLSCEGMHVVKIINVDNNSVNYILKILSKFSCKLRTNNFTSKY